MSKLKGVEKPELLLQIEDFHVFKRIAKRALVVSQSGLSWTFPGEITNDLAVFHHSIVISSLEKRS